MRGNETVNQSISSSFDPAKLMCISCSNEHPVFDKKPVVIIFSDQNFVPALCGKCCDCIHIVRLENASLLELFDLANEILGEVTFQEGSTDLDPISADQAQPYMLGIGQMSLHDRPLSGAASRSAH
jgi:hypothetical protein